MSKIGIRPAIQRNAEPEKILSDLKKSLWDSFSQLDRRKRCAVLFSGGVDSALAAFLTEKHCDDTLLITARCENSHDAKIAKRAADIMSLEHAELLIDSKSLWDILPDVIRVIGNSYKMNR